MFVITAWNNGMENYFNRYSHAGIYGDKCFREISGKSRRDLVALSSQRAAMLAPAQRSNGKYNGLGRIWEASKITMINTKPPYYRIYLLTVWQEQNRGPPDLITWRFRLEDPRSGRQQVFADAMTLLTALEEFVLASQEVDGMTTKTNQAEGADL